MKKLVIGSLLFLSPVAAFAADPPGKKAPPAPATVAQASNWGGLYVGANFGGGFGPIGDRPSMNRSGVLGGLQAGYGFQSGAFVYGVEADFDLANIRGGKNITVSQTIGNVQYTDYGTLNAKISSIGTLRGRIGYAMGDVLMYGTGGYARSRQTAAATDKVVGGSSSPQYYSFSNSAWVHGWTIGLGAEYALSSGVSLKAEYLHARFSNNSPSDSSDRVNLFRTGVNYRF